MTENKRKRIHKPVVGEVPALPDPGKPAAEGSSMPGNDGEYPVETPAAITAWKGERERAAKYEKCRRATLECLATWASGSEKSQDLCEAVRDGNVDEVSQEFTGRLSKTAEAMKELGITFDELLAVPLRPSAPVGRDPVVRAAWEDVRQLLAKLLAGDQGRIPAVERALGKALKELREFGQPDLLLWPGEDLAGYVAKRPVGGSRADGPSNALATKGAAERPNISTSADPEPPRLGDVPMDDMQLESIPALDQTPQWVTSKRAAKIEGLSGDSLRNYRSVGKKSADSLKGIDTDGRKWRKASKNAHAQYLRSSLRKFSQ